MLQFHVSGPLDVGPVLGPGMLFYLNINRHMSLRFSLQTMFEDTKWFNRSFIYRKADHTLAKGENNKKHNTQKNKYNVLSKANFTTKRR